MANPHVDKIQAELAGVFERGYDRAIVAMEQARGGNYSADKLLADAADTFVDAVWGMLAPVSELLPFVVSRRPALPVAEVELTTKHDETKVIKLIDTTTTAIDWENLTSGANTINKTNVDVKLAGNNLVVKVKGSGIPGTPALGTYEGNIKRTAPTPAETIGIVRLRYYVV